jgi:CDP-diacylglycerol--inositol 3-phosphatidyltransferase
MKTYSCSGRIWLVSLHRSMRVAAHCKWAAKTTTKTHTHIIYTGYVRVVLAVASLYYMPLHPRTCSFLYSISCLLDALDGYLARLFHQSTTFGGVLDMVTDRCTTACLLVFLSSAWPRWSILFQGLISLDLASHYMHMYATLSMGGSSQSHKKVDSSRSWVLHKYYTSRVCRLFFFFFLQEINNF